MSKIGENISDGIGSQIGSSLSGGQNLLLNGSTYTNLAPRYLSLAGERMDYFGPNTPAIVSRGGYDYLQVEVTKTNEITHPKQLDQNWDNFRSSIVPNAAIAPDGLSTADLFKEDGTAANTHWMRQLNAFTPDGSSNYTYSIYAKAAGRDWLYISLGTAGFTSAVEGYYDLANGVVGTSTGSPTSFGMESVGNGWYRCWIGQTSDAAIAETITIYLAEDDNDRIYDGDGASGIYLWHVQIETGTYPSSPIEYLPEVTGRAVDNLRWENASVPAGLRGEITFKWIPYEDYTTSVDKQLAEWLPSGASIQHQLYYVVSTDKIKIWKNGSGDQVLSNALTFSRNQELTITINPAAGSITVAGATTGNGTVVGTAWSTSEGDVKWGAAQVTTYECNGLISEPYDATTGEVIASFANATYVNASDRYLSIDTTLSGGAGGVSKFLAGSLATVGIGGKTFAQIETAIDNDFTEAQRFNLAYWTKTRSSITPFTTTTPDNTLTGDKLVEDSTAANTHIISRDITPDGASTYCFSVYAKADERAWIRLWHNSSGFPGNTGAFYDLSSGAVGTLVGTPDDTGIEDVGNGWYRCWFTRTSDAAISTTFSIALAEADSDITFNGDGSSGVYLWNAQLETSPSPTSPIHTQAEDNTRNADEFVWLDADAPELLRGPITFKWIPNYDYDYADTPTKFFFDMSASGGSSRTYCYYNGTFSRADRIIVWDGTGAALLVQSNLLTFSRGQVMTVTIDPAAGSLTIAGATTGNGTTTGTPWATTEGDVWWGSTEVPDDQQDGFISQPTTAT